MNIEISSSGVETLAVDALAVICFEVPGEAREGTSAVHPIPVDDPAVAAQDGWLAEMRASGEFTGKLYELAIRHRPAGRRSS